MASRYCSLDLKGRMLRNGGPRFSGLLPRPPDWDMAQLSIRKEVGTCSLLLLLLGWFSLTLGFPSIL